MAIDFVSKSPTELNSVLSRELAGGLFPFAQMLFEVLYEPISRQRFARKLDRGWYYPGWHRGDQRFLTEEELAVLARRSIPSSHEAKALNRAGLFGGEMSRLDSEVARCMRKKVVNLRDKIQATIREFEEVGLGYHRNEEGKDADRARALKWGAGEFLCTLQRHYSYLNEALSAVGRPPNPDIEVGCLWAQHFRTGGMRIPWHLISGLMDWFMSRLLGHAFYRAIFTKADLSDSEYLKQKFYRQKERWELIYAYRRRGKVRRLTAEYLGLDEDALDKEKMMIVFGPNEREFRGSLRTELFESKKAYKNAIPSATSKAVQEVIRSIPRSRNVIVFPDSTIFLD